MFSTLAKTQWTGNLGAALAGAGGGLLAFLSSETTGLVSDEALGAAIWLEVLLSSALWSGAIGLTLGAAILIYSNLGSLRGQWHRDLALGVPLFFALSFGGGLLGQIAYSVPNSFTRGLGWGLMGAGVGVGIGVLRRDRAQASRGALGGAAGGFLGGRLFDGVALVFQSGSVSRLVGLVLMGALIALLTSVVQNALKSAWLLGVSTGPYEGKEYPLGAAPTTIGRDDSNAIALFREREIAATLGAVVFQNQSWIWQGAPILINGAPQTSAVLQPGDTLQLGETRFRFQNRAVKSPAPLPNPNPARAINPDPNARLAPPAAHSAPAGVSASAPPAPPSSARLATHFFKARAASSSAAPFPAAPPALRPPALALLAPDGTLLQLPDLSAPIGIGRGAGNALALDAPGVSSHHARLSFELGALTLTDVGSTNGTFHNGVKLAPQTPQTLRPGDRVRFGPLEYTLCAG